uniref:Core shell protein Gag P30 domain-containing protein n=1 Tax=Pseudonaja textilis TaxID=8673 RepID=A0A670ZL74_PSETE
MAQGRQRPVPIQLANSDNGNNQVPGTEAQGIQGEVPRTGQGVRPKGLLQFPLATPFHSPVAGHTRVQLLAPLHQTEHKVVDPFGTIVKIHNPTWQYLEQLMNTLLNGEERERLSHAISKFLKAGDRGNLQAVLNQQFPRQDPWWDPYQDMTNLQNYQRLILQGLEQADKPPVNISKRIEQGHGQSRGRGRGHGHLSQEVKIYDS